MIDAKLIEEKGFDIIEKKDPEIRLIENEKFQFATKIFERNFDVGIENISKKFAFTYRIKHRPTNLSERIQDRGRWNDNGIRSDDQIFIDEY